MWARGASRVEGGVSCVEAIVSFEFYCVGGCAQIINGQGRFFRGAMSTLEMQVNVLKCSTVLHFTF